MSDSRNSTVRIGGRVLGALVSIMAADVVLTLLLVITPKAKAPIPLFPLYSEVVGIDAYGAVLPLLLCAVFVFFARVYATRRGGLVPFRGMQFWASILLLTIATIAVFQYVQRTSGGLGLSGAGAALGILAGEAAGIAYGIGRGPEMRAPVVSAEAFVVGVLAALVSDFVQTFTGWAQAPGIALVWGGSGTHDLVLWFAVYMGAAVYIFRRTSPWIEGRLASWSSRS